jgi:hypothetical protein
MFGAYIAGATIFGISMLILVARQRTAGWENAASLLVNSFVEFLLIWGILHS